MMGTEPFAGMKKRKITYPKSATLMISAANRIKFLYVLRGENNFTLQTTAVIESAKQIASAKYGDKATNEAI